MDSTNVARTTASYPKYQCHKEVSAAKIAGVEHGADGSLKLHLAGGFDNVVFSHEEMKRLQKPEAGWWLVVYQDGYRSFSPAKAFEEGYTPIGESAENETAGRAGSNVVAFDSAIRWREYAAALERKLNIDTCAIADVTGRTTPPTDEEIRGVAGLPQGQQRAGGLMGGNQLQSGTGTTAQNSEFGRRRDDAGEGTEDGAGDEAGQLDEVAANATG